VDRMGKHSPPLDGVVANGHAPAFAPFDLSAALEVRQGGPVLPWPQPDKRQRAMSAVRKVAAHRGWLAAIPVVLVNAVAFGAQLGFWRVHVPLLAEAVLVALALESIAIYLAWLAHLAQLADDSALRLRLAAYGVALVIGALNYNHFMLPGWRPTVEAVTFGSMSAISPWLWSAHSRRASRDALKAKGLIEPHAVRLGGTRWTWHLLRCVRVMSRATWLGETDPAKAIALPALKAARSDAEADPVAISVATPVPAPQVPTGAPAEDSRTEPAAPPVANAGGVPRKAAARRRTASAVATDDDLAKLVLPLFADGGEVTKYAVIKAVKETSGKTLGNERAKRILELARHAAADGKTS
jgi:hypothetical protein